MFHGAAIRRRGVRPRNSKGKKKGRRRESYTVRYTEVPIKVAMMVPEDSTKKQKCARYCIVNMRQTLAMRKHMIEYSQNVPTVTLVMKIIRLVSTWYLVTAELFEPMRLVIMDSFFRMMSLKE